MTRLAIHHQSAVARSHAAIAAAINRAQPDEPVLFGRGRDEHIAMVRGAGRSPPAATGWVLYDATCGICSRWAPWWSPTFARLGLGTAALQEPWVSTRLALPPELLLRDFCILLADGSLVRGADGYRWVLRRRWWAWPIWLIAAVPPTRWVFDAAYRTFARNRHAVSRACGIRPPPAG